MSAKPAVIVWFRLDLRLRDNPALDYAVASGSPVIPVYIRDPDEGRAWALGGASKWWLHHSLDALARSIRQRGNSLLLRSGSPKTVLPELIARSGAGCVCWNRRYEPWAIRRDREIKSALTQGGVDARSFNAGLLCEPWEIATGQGRPYRIFTPYWKALRTRLVVGREAGAPKTIPAPDKVQKSETLEHWELLPRRPDWACGFSAQWRPGEAAALKKLTDFTENNLSAYKSTRDRPSLCGTSRLSPHLHFGEVGPRQVWRSVTAASMSRDGLPMSQGAEMFLSEVAWREFAHHLIFHFPEMTDSPLRAEFRSFPWSDDAQNLKAWQEGKTGYPIVDAGMRQLWATGWMHNRVRMIAASFLIKDLLISWRTGARWFWDTLNDADLAVNSASWQWVAGCGTDAAPFFRIFNPVLQSRKFDPEGDYVKTWLPELARLSPTAIHAPWTAGSLELATSGIQLGKTYPWPVVNHDAARRRFLGAAKKMTGPKNRAGATVRTDFP